jgi:ABC-type uncharacterized transport system permease subunit
MFSGNLAALGLLLAATPADIVAGQFVSSVIALAIPLILVAYGGMFSEHSGIVNIALEGIMIVGSMIGTIFIYEIQNSIDPNNIGMVVLVMISGALLGGIGGALFSFMLSFAANRLKADQTIAGTAMDIIAPALYVIIAWSLGGSNQTNIDFPTWFKIRYSTYGLTSDAYSSMPGFFRGLIFGKMAIYTTYLACLLIPLAAFILYKTKFGLRMRSCGEHPEASASLGINVYKMRYAGCGISGFLGGIGGFAFSMAISSAFDGQVAGYGYLALAVMIFGNWKPGKIIFAALFFALFKTLAAQSSTITWLPTFTNMVTGTGPKVYELLPYVVTLIVLAFTSKHSQAPKSEGLPFDVSKRS